MLQGHRITLRRSEPADYPDIQRWQNHPEVFRWMDYSEPFSLDDIRRSEERAREEGHPFVIEADGRGIGRIGLNNFRTRDGLASLYVFIGEPSAWGKHYGLDAIMTLLRYGFDSLNLRKIELWTLGDNERAMHLYKNAGFVEEARLPERSFHEGVYLDHVVMTVDRAGFEQARERHGY